PTSSSITMFTVSKGDVSNSIIFYEMLYLINLVCCEHSNRAACWIDDKTVAVAYNPLEKDDESTTKDSPQELHFYQIKDGISEIKKKVQVKGLDIVSSRIYFNKALNVIFFSSDKQGIAIISLEGEILFHDKELNLTTYDPTLNRMVKTDDKSVTIYKIEK
ncbi:MAG: hypothetical protein AAFX55_09470, partial [Bacteroidota bacterium]